MESHAMEFKQLRSFVEPECTAQAALKIGAEDLATAVDLAAENLLLFVETAAHAGVLSALPAEKLNPTKKSPSRQ